MIAPLHTDETARLAAPDKQRPLEYGSPDTALHDHAEHLRRSEAGLRALLESAPIILYAVDRDGTITLSEGMGLTALGLKPGEVVGRSVFEFSGSPENEAYTRRAQAGEAVAFDVQAGELWMHTELRPLRSEDGSPNGHIGVCFDVTERKQYEELLAESRQRLTLATASAQIGIWDWDVAANKMIWDTQMYALHGIHAQDFGGAYEAWQNGLHPEDRDRAEAEIALALEGSEDFHTQFRVVWPSGEVRHIEAHAIVLRAEDGSVQRMTGVNWDVTARRQAEEERARAEERFRVLFECSSDAYILFDEGGIIDCNPATTILLRCADKAEVLSLHPAVLSPEFQPDGRRSDEKSVEMDVLARELGLHRFEWTHRRADGEDLPVEVTLTYVMLGDRHVLLVVWHDLTERYGAGEALRQSTLALQESQARLVEAQCIAGIGDWELDMATQRHTWSAEMYRLMEFDPAEGMPDYSAVLARWHADDRAHHARQFAQAMETGEPFQYDMRLILPSGTPRWCHLVGRPVRDSRGVGTHVVGTMIDITERMAREQQVRDANRILELQKAQLEAANEVLETLATTDPLTGLLNHRAFQMRLAEETARVQHEESSFIVVMLDLDNFKFFNDVYGHSVGDQVLRQVAERLREACPDNGDVARFGGDEFALLLPDVGALTASEVEEHLRQELGNIGYCPLRSQETVPITVSLGASLHVRESPGEGLRPLSALDAADERLRVSKTGGGVTAESQQVRITTMDSVSGFSMLDALVTAVDNKDRYTRKHSEDVMAYSLMIARELGQEADTLRTVAVAALLHDVGKIGVPDAILRKPGKLTDAEFETIQQHPLMGAIIVQAVPGLEDTLDAVRHHHERWDGKGYPFGLKERNTPLIARLMAVADAFSAMTTDRPYRKGMAHEKAMSILEAGAGTQWDPECVAAFQRAWERAGGLSVSVCFVPMEASRSEASRSKATQQDIAPRRCA